MNSTAKRTSAALAGALVLASGGYAIGSQAGDGQATAATSGSSSAVERPAEARGGRGLDDLASRLGVSASKLRAALEKVRAGQDPKGDRSAAFAKALGLSTAQVEAAFEQLHAERRKAFAAALGRSLGVDAAKVEAALEKAAPAEVDGRRGPRVALSTLAKELGVSTAKLRSALRDARPARGDREDKGAALAKALGVSEEKLEAAREQVMKAHRAEHEARADAFAEALAKELGISADKVKEELGDGPFSGRGHGGPGGRGGHGGHGGVGGHGPR